MSKRKREAKEFTELTGELEPAASSSLMVAVDYLQLVEQVGEAEAWTVLGKLKDLLG